jgi:hypothetical protein
MSPRWNWDSPTPLAASECALPPRPKGGGAHSPLAKGVGEFQFQRLEKRSALCLLCGTDGQISVTFYSMKIIKHFCNNKTIFGELNFASFMFTNIARYVFTIFAKIVQLYEYVFENIDVRIGVLCLLSW